MAKSSKLREKPVRFSDTRTEKWDPALSKYRTSVAELQSESAKSHRFAMFVQEVLDVHPEVIDSYCVGIEQHLKTKEKDRVLRGRADNLFGNVILEFERDLSATLNEAQEQLRRYAAILWSQEKPGSRRRYLCVAGDGLEFRTYSAKLQQPAVVAVTPEMVTLVPLERLDWRTASAEEVFYWLDRHLLRKESLHPTSEEIVRDFGPKSHAFQIATERLQSLWSDVKGRGSFAVIYEHDYTVNSADRKQ